MVSWEGRFNWQGYALSGRPDFLNYLNAGDVTWDELWEFYRQSPVPSEAVRALTRLFHLFVSSEYDAAGCWLDPDGEVAARLRSWASFALEAADRLPLELLQADLAGLVGSGLITLLYYEAVYLVYVETSVERHASAWTAARLPGEPVVRLGLPGADERRLPVYHPGAERFSHLAGDPNWDAALRSLIATQYQSWNAVFVAQLPDEEHDEAWITAGGEG